MHGFYAFMGGPAIEIPGNLPESQTFLPNNRTETWFLTCDGIDHFVNQEERQDDIPNLSKEEIKAKSKANELAKTLVCIQAFWFITQCITRGM